MEASPIEIPRSVIPEGATSAVHAALQNPEWTFRTPRGIEEDTGVPAAAAEAILEMSPEARKSVFVNGDGQPVYASIYRRRTFGERVEAIRIILSGNVADY